MNSFSVSTSLPIKYELKISNDIFNMNSDLLLSGRDEQSTNCLVCVDINVYFIYKDKINSYFSHKTKSYKVVLIDSEDENKNVGQFLKIFNQINGYPINRRNEPVVIIGGGVATDIAAFATSCFRRGIPHVKVPTTIMGYVDASVGIKTGINFEKCKNRMGSFYPPQSVVLDKSFFNTQTNRDISNGAAEIIKIAVIRNIKLFNLLVKHAKYLVNSKFQCSIADEVLLLSISDMIEELEPNLFEDNLQRSVDFGHTFSLVFEMDSHYDIKHGEAVSMDIFFSTYLAWRRGLVSKEELLIVYNLILSFSLPIIFDLYDPGLIWESLNERVLHRNGYQYIPVPNSIGSCTFLNDVTYEEIMACCDEIQSFRVEKKEHHLGKYKVKLYS